MIDGHDRAVISNAIATWIFRQLGLDHKETWEAAGRDYHGTLWEIMNVIDRAQAVENEKNP